MNATITKSKKIEQSFNKVLLWLSEKEREVIERRVGLFWERETLQSIWNSFSPSITRERVRQIEDTWIKKIWRIIKATLLLDIQDKARDLLELHWGLLVKDKLINSIIKELWLDRDINASIIEVVIQSSQEVSKSKPRLGAFTYFYLWNCSKSMVDAIHKEALKVLRRKKDVMEQDSLYAIVKENLASEISWITIPMIDSSLDVFEDLVKWEETLIGLSRWKILNPKTLKDKAIYVMKKEKVPMHFVDISNKITDYLSESVKVNTIHNELIRNSEFVLIGRWIYALKEWWFTPWAVIDVIADILEKNGWPMTTEEITAKVLETRNVKKTTIYMNLQNKKLIERVWRNYYQLKK